MSSPARTTIRLDEHLLREAKKVAAETGRTLTAVIEDALRATLAQRAAPVERVPWTFPTFGSGGLKPGVDLDNNAGLLELMEADDDPL